MNHEPFLTIGMAVCDDYSGAYFTVQALRMMHGEVMHECEILICDNSPDTPHGQAVAGFIKGWVPNGRYVRANMVKGTAYPRERVFREARGKFTICIDSHVMIPPGVLMKFISWAKAHPDTSDLLQGPMHLDDLAESNMATEMKPTWGEGMWGQWHTDPRGVRADAEPYEIELHGLGLFACRTEAWAGFNPGFSGFGGEEGYIQAKYRLRGDRALCLPFLRWVHKFHPANVPLPYHAPRVLQVRNYLIGFTEIGKDWTEVLEEFQGKLTQQETLDLQMELASDAEKWERLSVLAENVS